MKRRKTMTVRIVSLAGIIFLAMTALLLGVIFPGHYRETLRTIRSSLFHEIQKESYSVYGTIFAPVEILTEQYAAIINELGFEDLETLERISRTQIAARDLIVGGGYWLEYYTIPDEKFFGPFWYKEGDDILLTWEYSNEENDHTQFDWYRNDGIATNQTVVWSDLYEDAVTGVPMITATSALMQGRDKTGVVTIDIGLEELTDYFSRIEIDLISDYTLTLLSREGEAIISSDTSRTGTRPFARGPEEGQEALFEEGNALVVYAPIASTGLVIALDTPLWHLTVPVTRSLARGILLALGVLAGSILLLGFVMNRRISSPIKKTVQLLQEISLGAGDLTQRIESTSNDELSEMATHFNETLKKVQSLVVGVKTQSRVLQSTGDDLAANMEESSAAVQQASSTLQEIKAKTCDQASNVEETTSTMKEITRTISALKDRIDEQAASVTQSSSAVEEMLANISSVTANLGKNAENVNMLTQASEKGRNDLSSVAEQIRKVSKDSEGLIKISSVIGDIARQTNLLSMNAAIEAAHAGESGAGFAVVAQEIRNLAESSAKQAKMISSELKKIKESVALSVGATEEVLLQFSDIDQRIQTVSEREASIRNAMDEQSAGSQEILRAIGLLNEITSQVQSGAVEIMSGSTEVIQESQRLGDVTLEVTQGIESVALGAQEITRAVQTARELSNTTKETILALNQELEKFKVE
ncbi:Methyl-accepting chemotaxis protein [Alkalispirochaeta americana]|uniref:Methyl-accepting chemotaxis protein n=1 Tax=Alkalispirochaeta americana TaxID=159291 RepID=A0A1N6WDW7_9SPIO|nr:methyl-accepting chemotaxis protein [Alkalispirochaeta americana]SIQ88339.1 Methyl-accepting chemotaxis protein [Alkalispirochaeta americana]